MYAAFDADAAGTALDDMHLRLGGHAEDAGWPRNRLAVAVFEHVNNSEVARITKKLQTGDRGKPQTMTAVLELSSGRFFDPQKTGSAPRNSIEINPHSLRVLRDTIVRLAAKR